MNRVVLEFPVGSNLRIAILSSAPLLTQDFVATAPCRIVIDEKNGIFQDIPLEDPVDETPENTSIDENSIVNGDGDADADTDAKSMDSSMEMSGSDDDENKDFVFVTQIRV
jgi:hypothetical protein